MRYLLVLFIICIFARTSAEAQWKQCRVAFWNLENLFDTINAPAVADNEFTPTGQYRWTGDKYRAKTTRIRATIEMLNPVVMGLCEVENSDVIADILPPAYGYVHYDSPDIRGIDVALIYDQRRVDVLSSEPVRAVGARSTRDLLRVDMVVDGLPLTVVVAHLPSRRGNDPRASLQREAISRQLDSLSRTAHNIVICGDFNRNPSKDLLPLLYNTSSAAYRSGRGSYAYRDVWQMYDQIFVSNHLRTEVNIFTEGLIQRSGRFKGYPAKGAPSDHLPVFVDLETI